MNFRYSKKHPLWPVYDLQKKIIKRGGKIDRYSDLLAYFEDRSLEPEINVYEVLWNLANINESWNNKNYARTENLIRIEYLAYNQNTDGKVAQVFQTQRIKHGEKLYPGYGCKIPEKRKKGNEEKGYLLKDNEFVIRKNGLSQIIIINPDYVDIFRLIKNGYNPKTYNMKDKNVVPAIIIAAGLIIASLIYAYSHRYEVESYLRYDKWTGTMKKMELKD